MPYLPLGDGLLQQFQPQSFGTLRLFRSAPALHRLLIGISLAQVRKAKGIRLHRSGRRRVLMAIDLYSSTLENGRQGLKSNSYGPYGFTYGWLSHLSHKSRRRNNICVLIGNLARVHSLRFLLRHTHTTKQ